MDDDLCCGFGGVGVGFVLVDFDVVGCLFEYDVVDFYFVCVFFVCVE